MGMNPNMWGRVWHLADHPAIWVVPALGLVAFLGNFVLTHRVQSTSSYFWMLHRLWCHDIMCDITALHVHWSHDLLL